MVKKNKKIQTQLIPVVRTTEVIKQKKNKKKKRSNRNRIRLNNSGAMVSKYIATLNDPFENPGIRLGWGTFVPTDLYTAFIRFSFNTNADGSFGLAMFPTLANSNPGLYYNNAGAAVANWTAGPNYSNTASIFGSAGEARVVSGGIKILPQVPATANPGVIYTGSLPSCTPNGVVTNTINFLTGNPVFRVGYGATGAVALIHPVDPTSYSFTQATILGLTTTSPYTSSTPIILGTGFPASTTIFVEAVLNLETIISAGSSTGAFTSSEARVQSDDTLSSRFSSVESMWSIVKRFVPYSGYVNEAASVMKQTLPLIQGAKQLYNMANRRRNGRDDYFAGPSANRVLIEELD